MSSACFPAACVAHRFFVVAFRRRSIESCWEMAATTMMMISSSVRFCRTGPWSRGQQVGGLHTDRGTIVQILHNLTRMVEGMDKRWCSWLYIPVERTSERPPRARSIPIQFHSDLIPGMPTFPPQQRMARRRRVGLCVCGCACICPRHVFDVNNMFYL